jgi:hypothetical protein
MTVNTLFLSPLHQAFNENVESPDNAAVRATMRGDVRHNILYSKIEQYELASAATRAINLANYTPLTDWPFIMLRVVGEIKVTTVGVDTDNSTAIGADIPCYGTSLLPGIFVLSSYNVTSFTIESLADDSIIELFAGIAAEDDDARLDDNA